MRAMIARRWFWVVAAAVLAVAGVAAADRALTPKMPGTCAMEIVPFCADPSWPDAG
jgi:hypothetical protein